MSDPGNFEGLRIEPEMPKPLRRPGCAIGCLTAVIGFIFISALAKPYTEWLWYLHDGRHPEVFTTAYAARGTLFTFSFVLATALFAFCFLRALTVGQVFTKIPESIGEVALVRMLDWVRRNASGAARLAAIVLGVFFALGFAREWNTYLLWRNSQPFGVKDPTFGLDIGFFVFELPWYTAIFQFMSGLLLLASLATGGIYIGLNSLARLAKIELNQSGIRFHMSLLIGLTFVAFGVLAWFKRYEYGLMESPQFTGAGYSAMQKLAVQGVLSIIAILIGVWTLLSSKSARPFTVPIGGAVFLGAAYVLAMVTWPLIVQKFQVEPNKLAKETPYATKSIRMTRWAFGLDKIEVRPMDVQDVPSKEDVDAAAGTLEAMRLWDPEVLRQSMDMLQGLKPYYAFNDVDVDRYLIDGRLTPVMLSPRDIRLEGLTANATTWVNTRLQFTHGYGVVVAAVNGSTENGDPLFLIRDFPPKTPKDLPLVQPRIYYTDLRDNFGIPKDEYALVDTKLEEFDYPTENAEMSNRWSGGRGIPIGGQLARAAFSMVLGDGNLLISTNVTNDTRLLVHRTILDRVNTLYPFLKFDNDPYIVLLDGKIIWLLDGYTCSDMVPYSEFTPGEEGQHINYIRNSVKITIDAYSGETRAYAVQPNEPILRAYRKIYPKLIHDVSEMPAGLKPHWRYPEDLLRLQASALTQYHVTDPIIFLNNSDAWELPRETNPSGAIAPMKPYYVHMRLPGAEKEGFILILPLTPRLKKNMNGWLAAHCDEGDYGKMVLYLYPKGSNMAGPEQMESKITQDPSYANINKLWNTDQNKLIGGNLLVVPTGKSVLYVRPLFTRSTSNPQPQMKRVVLAINNRIVIAEKYRDGLEVLLGGQAGSESQVTTQQPEQGQAPPSGNQDLRGRIKQAASLLDQADAALRSGDFAKYGSLQKQARELLKTLAK